MDCTRARDILAAAFESPVPAEDLAAARAHAQGCPDCADLVRALDALVRTQAPVAPTELVDRLVAMGSEAAGRVRAEADSASESLALEPVHESASARPSWIPRITSFAAIAAVLLVALTITGLGIGGAFRGQKAAVDSTAELTYAPQSTPPVTAPDMSSGTVAADRALMAAPDWVVFGTGVYRLVGPATAERSSLASVGVVYTALDSPDASPTAVPAYRPASDAFALVLEPAVDTYLAFEPITRRFGGEEYQLQSSGPIWRYGEWPALPSAYATPTAGDGSPSFGFFGVDDAGVRIYVPRGKQPQDGFAVAPDMPSTDPTAGAPLWTWWKWLR